MRSGWPIVRSRPAARSRSASRAGCGAPPPRPSTLFACGCHDDYARAERGTRFAPQWPEVTVEYKGKKDDSLAEEASALGQRAKGAAKDVVGDVMDDEELESEGERENAVGRARQANNKVLEETDGVTGRTVTPSGYVTGLYSTPEAASRAYEGLTTKHGYKSDDINVVMSEGTRKRYFGDVKPGAELSHGSKAAEGLGKGAAIGGGDRKSTRLNSS